jgi:dTDP-4-dehydrorhamnose reductase
MCNILVTGSKGQLGSELKELVGQYLEHTFYFTDYLELDITQHNKVEEYLTNNKITVIINCAAYTAVDKAENEVALCNDLNNLAVLNFSKIAKEKSIKLIQISTDYIFDGTNCRPYLESDVPNPKSIYGETKLAGEKAMVETSPSNSVIIRTSWVYSSYGHNFVKSMLKLATIKEELSVIFDQVGTPTYARDLAKLILDILPNIKNKNVEIYHYSNEGVCSWFDFSKEIFKIKDQTIKVNPIQTDQYPTPAKRPFYGVLNKAKIKNKFNITIPYWRDSLVECLYKL